MAEFTFYGSFEEMMEAICYASRQADSIVMPAQANIKPGQFYINNKPEYGFAIFREILDISKLGISQEKQKLMLKCHKLCE